jgi:hypothetical protein
MSTSLFDNGAIGAATVTVLTELILMAGAIILRPAGVLDRAATGLQLRIVVASAAMIPVVLALGSQPLAVKILAGILTYGVASLVLRTTSLREVRALTSGAVERDRSQSSVAV